jgi:CHAD domain-containing protein
MRLAPGLAAIRQKAFTRWNRRQEMVQGQDDPETLHQFRIAVKRLRYTLELCHLANEHNDRRSLERLAEMQRVLGDLHDSDILLKFLVESRPEAPVESIAGLADITRIIKQGRQELAKRFSSMAHSRTLTAVTPGRGAARRTNHRSTGLSRQPLVRV